MNSQYKDKFIQTAIASSKVPMASQEGQQKIILKKYDFAQKMFQENLSLYYYRKKHANR